MIDYAFQVPRHERGRACRHCHDGPRWVHTTATLLCYLCYQLVPRSTTGMKILLCGACTQSQAFFGFLFCSSCASFGGCGLLRLSAHVGVVGSVFVDGWRCSVHSKKLPADGNIGSQRLCWIDRLQVKVLFVVVGCSPSVTVSFKHNNKIRSFKLNRQRDTSMYFVLLLCWTCVNVRSVTHRFPMFSLPPTAVFILFLTITWLKTTFNCSNTSSSLAVQKWGWKNTK